MLVRTIARIQVWNSKIRQSIQREEIGKKIITSHTNKMKIKETGKLYMKKRRKSSYFIVVAFI